MEARAGGPLPAAARPPSASTQLRPPSSPPPRPPNGFTMLLPEGTTGVYTFQASTPANPHGREHVNVDQYSGRILASYGFADYGPLAKAVTQGIALHEGRRFGFPNQLVNLAMCAGVLFLAVSGLMMWWRRRPEGALATAPRRPRDVRALRGAWVVMVAVGALLPLGGVTMLAVVALDRFVVRRIPRLAKVFASA